MTGGPGSVELRFLIRCIIDMSLGWTGMPSFSFKNLRADCSVAKLDSVELTAADSEYVLIGNPVLSRLSRLE